MSASKLVRSILFVVLALVPLKALAQTHEYGSCWIERDNLTGTILHAEGDSLCTLEFPEDCYGGMMTPDSLYCVLGDIPEDMLPEGVVHAVYCEVDDDAGGSMMGGGAMMQMGFFGRPVQLSLDYDRLMVSALGMNPENLVLITKVNGVYQVIPDAAHDLSAGRFSLNTTELANWYGIIDGSRVQVDATTNSWGGLKSHF